MRYVSNLNEITRCPNCGHDNIVDIQDRSTFTRYKWCPQCHEEVCESDTPADIYIASTELMTPGEEFAADLREEIDNLKWCGKNASDVELIDRLSIILNKIADYIEEH